MARPGNMEKPSALLLQSHLAVVHAARNKRQAVIGEQLRDGYAAICCGYRASRCATPEPPAVRSARQPLRAGGYFISSRSPREPLYRVGFHRSHASGAFIASEAPDHIDDYLSAPASNSKI